MLLRASLVKTLHFDQSYTSVHASLCCQSLTASSFLNIQPQYNVLPHITVIAHSDSERGIFPSAAVAFQCCWCLMITCLHPALFFSQNPWSQYTKGLCEHQFLAERIFIYTQLCYYQLYTPIYTTLISLKSKIVNKILKKTQTLCYTTGEIPWSPWLGKVT